MVLFAWCSECCACHAKLCGWGCVDGVVLMVWGRREEAEAEEAAGYSKNNKKPTWRCGEQWNIMKHREISWNTVKHHETSWKMMKHHVSSWKIIRENHDTSSKMINTNLQKTWVFRKLVVSDSSPDPSARTWASPTSTALRRTAASEASWLGLGRYPAGERMKITQWGQNHPKSFNWIWAYLGHLISSFNWFWAYLGHFHVFFHKTEFGHIWAMFTHFPWFSIVLKLKLKTKRNQFISVWGIVRANGASRSLQLWSQQDWRVRHCAFGVMACVLGEGWEDDKGNYWLQHVGTLEPWNAMKSALVDCFNVGTCTIYIFNWGICSGSIDLSRLIPHIGIGVRTDSVQTLQQKKMTSSARKQGR